MEKGRPAHSVPDTKPQEAARTFDLLAVPVGRASENWGSPRHGEGGVKEASCLQEHRGRKVAWGRGGTDRTLK